MKEKICCVCGHKLSLHIDEDDVWRCHTLGPDAYQCECILRKDRAENKINYYDAERRCKEHEKELKIGWG